MRWRHTTGATLIVTMLAQSPARALGPSWGYVDYYRLSGHLHPDEPGRGDAARLSVPLGEVLYFGATIDRIDAKYDSRNIAERSTVALAGLGLHTTGTAAQLFGLVGYAKKNRVQYAPTEGGDHASGVGLAVGVRWLATPYLLIEPQGGLKGYDLDGFLKLTVDLRLFPYVWAVGEFNHNVIHGNEYLAGLRIAWSDYTPTTPPSARVVAAPADGALGGGLAVGQTLVTLRPLVPQVRPAAGAPELAPIPKDENIVLQERIQNDFGTWWRIGAADQPQWIRETDLKGRP